MVNTLTTFSKIFAVAVVACVVMGGGLLFLIASVTGYAVGMWFIEKNLR